MNAMLTTTGLEVKEEEVVVVVLPEGVDVRYDL